MLSTSTASDIITDSVATFKDIAGPAIAAVVAVAVLLIGAGFVWSRFRRHVSGKKI